MNKSRRVIRSHYETRGEPLRSVADRFDVPFSTLGKRAVREKWQRSVPPNGNKDGNTTTVFPEIGNKIGNKHGNSDVLFPKREQRWEQRGSVPIKREQGWEQGCRVP